MNKVYGRITELLLEKIGQGLERDIPDTAKKIGQWYQSINPKAKPGEKGYMRKRNVPPGGGQYEHPEHDAYTRNKAHELIHKMAAHQHAAGPGVKGPGNLHDLHKAHDAAHTALGKSGTDELERHGVDPVIRRWSAKPGKQPRITTLKGKSKSSPTP